MVPLYMLDRHMLPQYRIAMKRVCLFLSEPQIAAFQALAEERDRPSAELIREALDDFLRRRAPDSAQTAERKRAATRRRS